MKPAATCPEGCRDALGRPRRLVALRDRDPATSEPRTYHTKTGGVLVRCTVHGLYVHDDQGLRLLPL